ncbi:unnamed protein product [Chrysoparadoxa australica]
MVALNEVIESGQAARHDLQDELEASRLKLEREVGPLQQENAELKKRIEEQEDTIGDDEASLLDAETELEQISREKSELAYELAGALGRLRVMEGDLQAKTDKISCLAESTWELRRANSGLRDETATMQLNLQHLMHGLSQMHQNLALGEMHTKSANPQLTYPLRSNALDKARARSSSPPPTQLKLKLPDVRLSAPSGIAGELQRRSPNRPGSSGTSWQAAFEALETCVVTASHLTIAKQRDHKLSSELEAMQHRLAEEAQERAIVQGELREAHARLSASSQECRALSGSLQQANATIHGLQGRLEGEIQEMASQLESNMIELQAIGEAKEAMARDLGLTQAQLEVARKDAQHLSVELAERDRHLQKALEQQALDRVTADTAHAMQHSQALAIDDLTNATSELQQLCQTLQAEVEAKEKRLLELTQAHQVDTAEKRNWSNRHDRCVQKIELLEGHITHLEEEREQQLGTLEQERRMNQVMRQRCYAVLLSKCRVAQMRQSWKTWRGVVASITAYEQEAKRRAAAHGRGQVLMQRCLERQDRAVIMRAWRLLCLHKERGLLKDERELRRVTAARRVALRLSHVTRESSFRHWAAVTACARREELGARAQLAAQSMEERANALVTVVAGRGRKMMLMRVLAGWWDITRDSSSRKTLSCCLMRSAMLRSKRSAVSRAWGVWCSCVMVEQERRRGQNKEALTQAMYLWRKTVQQSKQERLDRHRGLVESFHCWNRLARSRCQRSNALRRLILQQGRQRLSKSLWLWRHEVMLLEREEEQAFKVRITRQWVWLHQTLSKLLDAVGVGAEETVEDSVMAIGRALAGLRDELEAANAQLSVLHESAAQLAPLRKESAEMRKCLSELNDRIRIGVVLRGPEIETATPEVGQLRELIAASRRGTTHDTQRDGASAGASFPASFLDAVTVLLDRYEAVLRTNSELQQAFADLSTQLNTGALVPALADILSALMDGLLVREARLVHIKGSQSSAVLALTHAVQQLPTKCASEDVAAEVEATESFSMMVDQAAAEPTQSLQQLVKELLAREHLRILAQCEAATAKRAAKRWEEAAHMSQAQAEAAVAQRERLEAELRERQQEKGRLPDASMVVKAEAVRTSPAPSHGYPMVIRALQLEAARKDEQLHHIKRRLMRSRVVEEEEEAVVEKAGMQQHPPPPRVKVSLT